MIGNTIAIVVTVAVAYFMLMMYLNDRATTKINERRVSINSYLRSNGLQGLFEISQYDDSPCQVEFTVIEGAKVGIESSVFWWRLKRCKKDKTGMALKRLVHMCIRADDEYRRRNAKQKTF